MTHRAANSTPVPPVIFLHIPKAAGTTLARIMGRQYPGRALYAVDGSRVSESIAEFKALPPEQRASVKAMIGHMPFGLHRHLPGSPVYITVLRDPVKRIVSHYRYARRTPEHYLHDTVCSENMSLEAYVASGISVELNNGQTRLLSGVRGADPSTVNDPADLIPFGQCSPELLERAKANLEEHFPVVGLTERFDETLILLKRVLGWQMPLYTSRNVAGGREQRAPLSQETVAAMRQYNQLDIELYAYAARRFARAVHAAGPGFERELVSFKRLNRAFQVVTSPLIRLRHLLRPAQSS